MSMLESRIYNNWLVNISEAVDSWEFPPVRYCGYGSRRVVRHFGYGKVIEFLGKNISYIYMDQRLTAGNHFVAALWIDTEHKTAIVDLCLPPGNRVYSSLDIYLQTSGISGVEKIVISH